MIAVPISEQLMLTGKGNSSMIYSQGLPAGAVSGPALPDFICAAFD